MSNSSAEAILYPSLKIMEKSNSSFMQLPPNVRENKSTLSRRDCKFHRATKSKLRKEISTRPNALSYQKLPEHEAKEVNIQNTELGKCHLSIIPPTIDEDPKINIEQSQQWHNQELVGHDNVNAIKTVSVYTDEITETSLKEFEYLKNLRNEYPNHTFIINNTIINPIGIEPDEFMSKLSQLFNNTNSADKLILLMPPEKILESIKQDNDEISVECYHNPSYNGNANNNQGFQENVEKEIHISTESFSVEMGITVGSIIMGVLWIILIFFWFLMYFKVINVYTTLPRVIPKPEPTNYELCLMFLRKCIKCIGHFWKFWSK